MIRKSRVIVCLFMLTGAIAAYAGEIDNDTCLGCHSDKTLTGKGINGKEVSLFVDADLLKASVHKAKSCATCHSDLTGNHPDDGVRAKPVDCKQCHEREWKTYTASVHGIESARGNRLSPGCVDCHGSHEMLSHTSPQSPLHFSKLTKTCGGCHEQESKDVQASVHGHGAALGERESPTCIDCHNEHQIEKLKGASPYKISVEICSKCHASARINAQFQMPADRVETFLGSYHGLAMKGESAIAANCASCHGYHKILPSKDQDSTINKDHLVATCGKCHPGATENFAFSKVHTDDITGRDRGATANRWVRRVYLALIFLVVGSLFIHNLLAWLRSAKAARKARGDVVMRMDPGQRTQHFILLSCFILLALTGFALKYPDTWLAWVFGSSESIRRWIHRGAGVVLIGLGGYHLLYVIFTIKGRRLIQDFLPRWQDVRDIRANLRYFTGRDSAKPKFGRFGYAEKIEYWAVGWGIVIMGVTGLMIWLKMDVTQYLPRWVVEVALTIHYYEAILACLAIAVWHFYHVIFAPDVYPMNWAWWDGKVPEDWQHQEHPLDQEPPPVESAPPKESSQSVSDKSQGEGI